MKAIDRFLENVAKLKYFGMTLTSDNCIPEEIPSRLNLEHACYHSVHNLSSPSCKDNGPWWDNNIKLIVLSWGTDRFCGLVVRLSRLQIQRSGFDSQPYQIFWEVVGLELGPLSLVSTTEELLGRKSSGSGLENREYGRRDLSCWPRGTLYPQKLELTSLTSGSGSVDIVRSRTQATEFSFFF
jgi:hypothetical protein